MQLQTPLTGSMYGIAVYPGAAHMSTSCTPNVRPLFTEAGIVQLVAMEAMPAGTEITIGRGGPAFSPFFRCIQTGPPWIRSMADNTSGVRCTCNECKITIAWLRQSAGAKDDAQMSEETVQRIVTIVNDTWKGSDDKQPWSYHADVADILAFPLRLPHVSEFAELATMVPAGTIEAFCRLGALRLPNPPGLR